MNPISRFVAATVVAIHLGLPIVTQASSASHLLKEEATLALLKRILKDDGVYTHRISLDCVLTAQKRQTTLIFSLFSAKITTPNAAETPKRVP